MRFVELYHEQVLGVISGLDRIRFRGTERCLSNIVGFKSALRWTGILLKDFGTWADSATKAIRSRCASRAKALDIPVRYLSGGGVDKEALAREIAAQNGVAPDGSICMLSAVEYCVAPTVRPNRETKRLEVEMLPRKCVFIYYYFDDPQVGFGHVRLQTWAPYPVHICLNGRHWLEKQLAAADVGYLKSGNCFPWIENVGRAQELLEEQLKANWPSLLDGLVNRMCPDLEKACAPLKLNYYWSAEETEYATDVMFHSATELDRLFPVMVQYGMRVSNCLAVLRYFGRRTENAVTGKAPEQIQSDCRERHEAVRIKHWLNGNSIKMYNKAQTVLRVETTINKPREFKAFRPANDDETRPPTWQRMRKGVNDLHRRCEVSQKCNERYLDALSAARVHQTLHEVAAHTCNRTIRNGRSVRGLNPWNEQDYNLLAFIAKGEWALNGFRNADLCKWINAEASALPQKDRRKLSHKATRLIGMLRAHGLVRKIQKEHRYLLTETGRTFASAILIASSIDTKQLMEIAA